MILKSQKENPKQIQISNALGDMLNIQKDNEMYNHNLYKKMSNWYSTKGLNLLADYYQSRGEEEKHHHDIIVNRLRECNYPIMYTSTEVKEEWETEIEPLEITVDAEFKTTESINNIICDAFKECDYKIAHWLMSELIDEQHEEEYISILALNIGKQDTDWLTKQTSIYDAYTNKTSTR